jgi:hypothetical protein
MHIAGPFYSPVYIKYGRKPHNKKKSIQEVPMPKDSQPDNKKARMEKCNGQTPITRENQNKNKNAKRKSIEHNDV